MSEIKIIISTPFKRPILFVGEYNDESLIDNIKVFAFNKFSSLRRKKSPIILKTIYGEIVTEDNIECLFFFNTELRLIAFLEGETLSEIKEFNHIESKEKLYYKMGLLIHSARNRYMYNLYLNPPDSPFS